MALQALCRNSLEAIGHEWHIEISLHEGNGDVKIRVSDDGPGIPPEERRHLFDPYYSARQAGRGLGLGLSKCWRIVTNHGAQPARSVALRLHLNQAATFATVDRTVLQQEAPAVRLHLAEQQVDLILPELPGGASSAYTVDYESSAPLRADGAAPPPSVGVARIDPGFEATRTTRSGP